MNGSNFYPAMDNRKEQILTKHQALWFNKIRVLRIPILWKIGTFVWEEQKRLCDNNETKICAIFKVFTYNDVRVTYI